MNRLSDKVMFLKGKTASSEEMLNSVKKEVDRLCEGRKVVIIDGVGYPAVGSICGVSNADIAKALGTKVGAYMCEFIFVYSLIFTESN